METHAPDHPITGWKDAAKHLVIITAGVLIALAFEGIVSWADHRLLVREATANVIAELRTNKKELDGLFANLEQEKAQLEHADELAAPGAPSAEALERWKSQIDVALAGLTSREQLGRLLQKRYEELLSGK